MIICPNCEHPNPDGAIQCEACYTSLPAMITCPNCGAATQAEFSFCCNCGVNLKSFSPVPPPPAPVSSAPLPIPPVTSDNSRTQIQQQVARLIHQQTNSVIELPSHLAMIHLGKPNSQIPPDIDVSEFPHSDIVSRVHADIRVEGEGFYLEDAGSTNGTYINHAPLPPGNRYRLRSGDRIALGKGDRMTFVFVLEGMP